MKEEILFVVVLVVFLAMVMYWMEYRTKKEEEKIDVKCKQFEKELRRTFWTKEMYDEEYGHDQTQ